MELWKYLSELRVILGLRIYFSELSYIVTLELSK